MSDGEIGNDSKVFNGGLLNFSGGMIGSGFVVSGGGVANISGGSILSGFNVLDGGEVNVSGGSIGSGSTVIDGGVVNISGGTLSHRYRGLSGSATHIAGTEFLLDGVPVDGLTLGVPLTILDRDVVLSGVLADGTPFDFALNSVDNFIDDVFETDATVTITLVPEPSAVVLATGALLALVGARFRARSADGSSRCSPRPRRSFPASSHARLCCLPAPR